MRVSRSSREVERLCRAASAAEGRRGTDGRRTWARRWEGSRCGRGDIVEGSCDALEQQQRQQREAGAMVK